MWPRRSRRRSIVTELTQSDLTAASHRRGPSQTLSSVHSNILVHALPPADRPRCARQWRSAGAAPGAWGWHVAGGSALSGLADLIVVNFAIAVLIGQQHVLNAICAVAGRGSSRWPLRLRWMVSKINQIGGLLVGAALAGTARLCALAVVTDRSRQPARGRGSHDLRAGHEPGDAGYRHCARRVAAGPRTGSQRVRADPSLRRLGHRSGPQPEAWCTAQSGLVRPRFADLGLMMCGSVPGTRSQPQLPG